MQNKRGVTYSRSSTGTNMPFKKRFQTRPCRACLRAPSLKSKLSVSWRTAAEASRNDFWCWLRVARDFYSLLQWARVYSATSTEASATRTLFTMDAQRRRAHAQQTVTLAPHADDWALAMRFVNRESAVIKSWQSAGCFRSRQAIEAHDLHRAMCTAGRQAFGFAARIGTTLSASSCTERLILLAISKECLSWCAA